MNRGPKPKENKLVIKKIKENGIIILAPEGELNLNTVSRLRSEFDALYDQGVRKLVMDFDKVTYIDSVGLALIIEMLQRLGQNNGSLALANMGDKIKYLFEAAKIDTMLSIFKNRNDAIASM